eukprot:6173274-Pleurochrysis_carterae.AAC.2
MKQGSKAKGAPQPAPPAVLLPPLLSARTYPRHRHQPQPAATLPRPPAPAPCPAITPHAPPSVRLATSATSAT